MTRLRGLAGYLGALGLVVLASALIALVSAEVRIGNVSILYLPAVLIAAVRFGRGPAIFASLGAFLLYDVLFIEPRFHLSVADANEWIALVLLLVTAAVVGQLASDQRAQARAAVLREHELADAEVLRRADDAKSALLHAVSHDLRTPLSSIIAGASSLRQEDVDWSDEEREEFLAGIENEARRLDRLVGDLLSVSRIEAGTLRPAKDWHDVADLVDDVVGRFRARTVRHRISVDLPDDLPAAMLDEVEIAQVLTNLIENAVKYAPEGTEILVRARTDGSQVRFDVLDRGPGVPAGAAARIFEPFERLGREGAPGGSGLGLAVAKRFVEAHGGRIWTEARSGGGSSFAFSVPIAG